MEKKEEDAQERSEKFHLECIRSLLVGLEIQHVEEFMSQLTPENCHNLGLAYVKAVKRKFR